MNHASQGKRGCSRNGISWVLWPPFIWRLIGHRVSILMPLNLQNHNVFFTGTCQRLGPHLSPLALFVGSALWFFKRSSLGWKMHIAGAEAGLACGLMAVWSGCVWGAAEWGTPWDWEDWRLNTFGLLTLLALFLVLGRQSQPDGVETRDTFSTFGLYGFILVPLTYVATRIWVIRHPGPVIAGDEDSSISGDMGLVLLIGAISFTVLIIGHILTSMEITKFEQRLERLQKELDGE